MSTMNLAETATDQGAPNAYLTVTECAGRLRVKPATIYAAIQNGEIRDVIRVGKKRGLRIPVTSYDAYVAGCLVDRSAPVAA
jgi:excisionase family DNA binding protein